MPESSRPRTAVLAILLGAAVGAAAGVYLGAVRLVEALVWAHGAPRLPGPVWFATIVTCVVGGVLVGLLQLRHGADTPHDLDDALLDIDEVFAGEEERTPPQKLTWLARAALLGVVSLGFGASLGPEAPLLVLATGLGRRVARLLRLAEDEASYISAAGALSGLFGGPLGSVVLPVEGSRDRARAASLLPYGVLASVAGLVAMLAVLPDGAGLRYDLPAGDIGAGRALLGALGWAAVAAVPATLAGLALMALTGPLRRSAERVVASPVLRGALGGLVLGACGAVAPLVLFSGEHEAQELITDAAGWTVGGLIAVAALKLVATLACLATGWFGGQFFPAVFTGIALGLIVVALAPSVPVAPVVAASAAATATAMLRRPLAVMLVLLVFFPLPALLAMTVGTAVATAAVHLLGDRAPQPSPLVH